jgi:hypothetical protein
MRRSGYDLILERGNKMKRIHKKLSRRSKRLQKRLPSFLEMLRIYSGMPVGV